MGSVYSHSMAFQIRFFSKVALEITQNNIFALAKQPHLKSWMFIFIRLTTAGEGFPLKPFKGPSLIVWG